METEHWPPLSLSAALGQAKRKKLRRGERDKRAESVQNKAKGDRGNATEMRIYVYENIFNPPFRPLPLPSHTAYEYACEWCGVWGVEWKQDAEVAGKRKRQRRSRRKVTLRCIFISRLCTGSC